MMAAARRVFDEIAKPGFAINTHIYNAMLHVFLKAGDAARAEALLRKLCEDGKMKEVNRLLNEMDARQVKADHVTCNTLINAYCKRGDVASACKVKKKMMGSGLQLDQSTYRALIHGFCKAKELGEAKDSLVSDGRRRKNNADVVLLIPDELTKRGLPSDKAAYRSLIRRLCRKGLVEKAQMVFARSGAAHLC